MDNEAQDDARKDDEKRSRPSVPVGVEDAAGEENPSRRQQGYLPVIDSIVSVAGVAAVAWGVWVAKETLVSIDENVEIANAAASAQSEQLKLSREQFAAARDALWLDQRPWLAISRTEAVPNEIQLGRAATFRFHVFNSGKTPAFNVRLLGSRVELQSNTRSFSEPSTWVPTRRAATSVFPNSTVYYNIDIPPIFSERFELYTRRAFNLAVAVRLEYCDANSSLHWTQLGVAKVFSEAELDVRHSTASHHPGEPDHPNCQDEAAGEP